MRRQPTPFERKLWLALRAKRFHAAKFRQQVVVGRYIADFACRIPRMLVVEVDGDTHALRPDYDERRTVFLKERGYDVLRLTNNDFATNFDGVLMTISDALQISLSPSGARAGERGSRGELVNHSPSPSAAFGRSLLSPEGQRK
jgi:very-short-patch-repair endonuclease